MTLVHLSYALFLDISRAAQVCVLINVLKTKRMISWARRALLVMKTARCVFILIAFWGQQFRSSHSRIHVCWQTNVRLVWFGSACWDTDSHLSDNYSNFPHFHAINMAAKILENTQWNSLTRTDTPLFSAAAGVYCIFVCFLARKWEDGFFFLFFFSSYFKGRENCHNWWQGVGKILPLGSSGLNDKLSMQLWKTQGLRVQGYDCIRKT